MGKSMFGIPMVPRVVSGGCGEVTATRTIRYSRNSEHPSSKNHIELYRFRENGWVSEDCISKNMQWVKEWKIFEPYASPGQDDYPHLILSKPIVAGPGKACTETYLVVGPFSNEKTTRNVSTYMHTQFFRFMLLLLKSTQHITKKVYGFVPQQDLRLR